MPEEKKRKKITMGGRGEQYTCSSHAATDHLECARTSTSWSSFRVPFPIVPRLGWKMLLLLLLLLWFSIQNAAVPQCSKWQGVGGGRAVAIFFRYPKWGLSTCAYIIYVVYRYLYLLRASFSHYTLYLQQYASIEFEKIINMKIKYISCIYMMRRRIGRFYTFIYTYVIILYCVRYTRRTPQSIPIRSLVAVNDRYGHP